MAIAIYPNNITKTQPSVEILVTIQRIWVNGYKGNNSVSFLSPFSIRAYNFLAQLFFLKKTSRYCHSPVVVGGSGGSGGSVVQNFNIF